MPLFSKSGYNSKCPEERLRAIESLEDQSILVKLASEDSSPRVRLAAVAKISDQETLYEIALNGSEIDARVAAAERIDSQRKLAELIKMRKNYRLMGACFARITDRQILNDIANDPNYNMAARRIAIESYADESYLSKVAEKKTNGGLLRSPAEIVALVEKHGGVRLVRALGRFRGSTSAMLALGEIIHSGGEVAIVALEYLAQALAHANPEVSEIAERHLVALTDANLIAHLIGMMDKPSLNDRILNVLRQIDHQDARQMVKSVDEEQG